MVSKTVRRPRIVPLAGPCLLAWLIFGVMFSVEARVFTPRAGGNALDDASSLGGKAVYAGRFVVNGSPCALRLIQMPDSAETTMRRLDAALGGGLAWGKARGAAISGSWADGRATHRLLVLPNASGGGSLLFVLDAREGAEVGRDPPRWPPFLPELSPSQAPIWVIEHPEARFTLASATTECPAMDAWLETCKARFEEEGWEPRSGGIGGERRAQDSGFALFVKKGKTCWVQARLGPSRGQATVVFLIKAD